MLHVPTPSEVEYAQRSRKFHASISAKSMQLLGPSKSSYVPRKYAINPAPFWPDMWFYDLVRCGETYVPGEPARPYFEIRHIQLAVAKHYKVKLSDMVSGRRTADLILPRHVAIYLAKELTAKSLPQIGIKFGHRDHTTILFAVRKIAKLVKVFPELAFAIDAITRRIKDETF
jgi:hypothetical protein